MSDRGSEPQLVQFPASVFVAMQRTLLSDHEPDEAARLLREMGLEIGSAVYDEFAAFLARSHDASPERLGGAEFWARLSSFFDELGWGGLAQDRPHPGVVALSSRDWREASDSSAGHLGCQITTGLIADLLRRAAGDDVSVLEVECRGAGAEQCRFLVGSEATLGLVFDRIKTGEHYPEAVSGIA